VKDKRILRRPWGRRLMGGWIIRPESLLEALKGGDVAEFGKLQVGAKQLSKLIALMQFPDQELLVRSNGNLEVENVSRVYLERGVGYCRTAYRKARLSHSFRVSDQAWISETAKPAVTLIIKPKKYG